MAKGFVTRKGGASTTKAPSLNFVSKTFEEIVFTVTNNDADTVDIFWEVDDSSPDANQLQLAGETTSGNITASGLTLNTEYTIFAFANKAGKAGSDTISLTQTTDSFAPTVATGGTVTDVNIGGTDYRIHAFTSVGTSTFTVTYSGSDGVVDVLVVGGGGAGAKGGGGAGGLIYNENISVNETNYSITVGNGSVDPESGSTPPNGENTTAFGLTALGGGGGGQADTNGNDGGSGGGTGYVASTAQISVGGDALQPTSASGGFGNDGGDSDIYSSNAYTTSSGGGGAGQAGQDGYFSPNGRTNAPGSDGGDGLYYGDKFTDNFGENGWFAGGGAGGDISDGAKGIGGIGGGGDGSRRTISPPENGMANTGAGGGGGSSGGSFTIGGDGGSGIVLIRYPLEEVS